MAGAVAIWHDIVPEGLQEFYAWHGEEHMPERVSIPGFRRRGGDSSPSRPISASSTSTTRIPPMSCAVPTTRRASIHPRRARCPRCGTSAMWRARSAAWRRPPAGRSRNWRRAASLRRSGSPWTRPTRPGCSPRSSGASCPSSPPRVWRRRSQGPDRGSGGPAAMSMPSSGRVARRTSSLLRDRGGGLGRRGLVPGRRRSPLRSRGARRDRLAGGRGARLLPARTHRDTRLTGLSQAMLDFNPFTNGLGVVCIRSVRRGLGEVATPEDKVTPVTLSTP